MKRFSALLAFLLALAAPSALGVDINGQLKKAQLEQQSSDPTAATARVYFNTLTNTAKIYNGTAWTSLGSGAGSGEKNYVSNGSSSAVGWAASSGNITCATTTSSMPDPSLGTALAVTGVSGSTDFCYTNFTLDDADFAKKLKLAWDQYAVSNTSADFRVDVCACAVAWSGGSCSAGTVAQGCGTNSTRLPLSTDSSSASLLPALTGSYRTTYDAIGTSKKYMQVQVGLAQTNTHQVNLANIVTGPGIVTQGAAVTEWQTYTPTIGGGAGITSQGWNWRRVGDSMEIEGRVQFSGAGAAAAVSVSLPSGYSVDTTKFVTLNTVSSVVGSAMLWNATATSYLNAYLPTATQINFTALTGSSDLLGSGLASGWQIGMNARVPIAAWAGSGTVNLAYSGTATATVSCDTPNGHGSTNTKIRRYTNCTSTGTAITYADSATLGASYTVNEAGVYSMTTSDKNSAAADVLGISLNTAAPTTAIQSLSTTERLTMTEGASNTTASTGATVKLSAGDVIRVHDDGTPNTTANYAYFRIAKVANDPSPAVGFASADANNAGLVSTGSQTFAGLKTLATGLSFGQSALNFYQEDDATLASVTFTPNGSTSTAVSGVAIKITRIGRAVTLNWTRGNTATCQSASTHIDSGTALPTWARPAAATQGPAIIWTNGSTWQWGDIAVATNGTISFYRDPGSSAFSNAATCGFDQGSWTFHI